MSALAADARASGVTRGCMDHCHVLGLAWLLTMRVAAPVAAQLPALRPVHPQPMPAAHAPSYVAPWSHPLVADAADEEAVLAAAVAQLLIPSPSSSRYGPRHVYVYATRMASDTAVRSRRLSDSLLGRLLRHGLVDGVLEDAAPADTMDVWSVQMGQVRQISADTAYVDVNTVETDRNPGEGCGFEGRTSIGVFVVRREGTWLVDRTEAQLVGSGMLKYPDTARCTKPAPQAPGS